MSPTQAREIIEAAGERIAEWEDRLRITNGDGVEVWNSSGGQMVAVAPADKAPPFEPVLEDWEWYLFYRTIVILNGVSYPWSSWQIAGKAGRVRGGPYDGLFGPVPGYPRSASLTPPYRSPSFGFSGPNADEFFVEFQSRTVTPAQFSEGVEATVPIGSLADWLLSNTPSGRRATLHFEVESVFPIYERRPYRDLVIPSGSVVQYYQPASLPGFQELYAGRISGLW
jgi:hypothetical protein